MCEGHLIIHQQLHRRFVVRVMVLHQCHLGGKHTLPRSLKALQVETTEKTSQMFRNASVRSVASSGSERSDAFPGPSMMKSDLSTAV